MVLPLGSDRWPKNFNALENTKKVLVLNTLSMLLLMSQNVDKILCRLHSYSTALWQVKPINLATDKRLMGSNLLPSVKGNLTNSRWMELKPLSDVNHLYEMG